MREKIGHFEKDLKKGGGGIFKFRISSKKVKFNY